MFLADANLCLNLGVVRISDEIFNPASLKPRSIMFFPKSGYSVSSSLFIDSVCVLSSSTLFHTLPTGEGPSALFNSSPSGDLSSRDKRNRFSPQFKVGSSSDFLSSPNITEVGRQYQWPLASDLIHHFSLIPLLCTIIILTIKNSLTLDPIIMVDNTDAHDGKTLAELYSQAIDILEPSRADSFEGDRESIAPPAFDSWRANTHHPLAMAINDLSISRYLLPPPEGLEEMRKNKAGTSAQQIRAAKRLKAGTEDDTDEVMLDNGPTIKLPVNMPVAVAGKIESLLDILKNEDFKLHVVSVLFIIRLSQIDD